MNHVRKILGYICLAIPISAIALSVGRELFIEYATIFLICLVLVIIWALGYYLLDYER